MGVVKFCVGAFLLVAVFREITGVHEKNPFISQVPPVANVVHPAPGLVLHAGVHPLNPHTAGHILHNPLKIVPPVNPQNPFLNLQPPVAVSQSPPPAVQPQVVPSGSPSVHPSNPQIGVYNPHRPITNIPPLNPQNPFFNPQQPHVAVAQPIPVQRPTIPPLNPHNPFLNPQQPHVPVTQAPPLPTQPSTIPPLNPYNPFLNPQQPHVPVTQAPPLPTQPSTIPPLNPYNPFLNPQQPHVPVTQAPPLPTQPSTIPPLNPHNPFLNPQQPHVLVTQAPLLPAKPSTILPLNPQNPFFNPHQPPVAPVHPPVVVPTQPAQPQSADYLRRRCIQARGQFPSAKCNKFVNCWDDLVVEQFCPEGLVFNSAGFCDYSHNVDCGGKPYEAIAAHVAPIADISAPTIVLPTTPLPPTYLPAGSVSVLVDESLKKKCAGLRGLFASDYCHRYVNCWDGNAVEQDCPPGLLFSSKGYCDFAYNVNCYNRYLIPSTIPTNLTPDSLKPKLPPTHPTYRPPLSEAPPPYAPLGDLTDPRLRKKCLWERGLFPSDYCNKFVNCWDKFAVEQECPAGLFFSDKGYCDYAYNVNCGNRIVTSIPVHQPPASAVPPTNLKPKPPPEVVVPTYRPTLPTQTNRPLVLPETTTSSLAVAPDYPLKKKCLRPRGQFPSNKCNRYVNCWDGYAVEQDCLPGLLFSEQGYCDYAFNVNCKNRTTTPESPPTGPPFNGLPVSATLPPHEPVQTVVTQVPPIPVLPSVEPAVQPVDPAVRRKCLGLRGQFASESCHKYIDCWDNVAVEHDCPPGLLFSAKGYCDYAYNVNCNNRTVIKTQATNTICPAPHGIFRDKSNCSRYFTCIENAVAAKYDCPSGLHFNDVIGVCDYAYRVDCNREPFVYQPLKNTNILQKVPASLLNANIECRPGRVLRLNPECSSVALCRNTLTEVVHCPAGMAYDAPSDRCLHPQLAKCQDS